MTDMTICQTIVEQLGGNKFTTMTGIHNFNTKGDNCYFKLPKNKSKANGVNIIYNYGSDTYTVQFLKITGGWFDNKKCVYIEVKEQVIDSYEHVFCDQLQVIFEDYTGLYTKL